MAQANLALAWERAGEAARARVAARHALGVPTVPTAVRDQAAGLLARLGAGDGDIVAVLGSASPDERTVLLRDEVARWNDLDDHSRGGDVGAWIDAQRASAGADDLGRELVGVLLELPPADLDRIARSVLVAAADRGHDVLEDVSVGLRRAARSFHAPQADRLEDVFSRAAAEGSVEGPWSSRTT
jgi:hypothetical protein